MSLAILILVAAFNSSRTAPKLTRRLRRVCVGQVLCGVNVFGRSIDLISDQVVGFTFCVFE